MQRLLLAESICVEPAEELPPHVFNITCQEGAVFAAIDSVD